MFAMEHAKALLKTTSLACIVERMMEAVSQLRVTNGIRHLAHKASHKSNLMTSSQTGASFSTKALLQNQMCHCTNLA
jgi:limonene-1,2-epoxide hydrolase